MEIDRYRDREKFTTNYFIVISGNVAITLSVTKAAVYKIWPFIEVNKFDFYLQINNIRISSS
jgi:hypothetical protein